jgi:DNA polymerase
MGQYGAGHLRYRSYLAGGPLGLPPIFITEEEAYHSIHGVYRAGHPETVATWRFLDVRLRDMLNPDCHFEYKGITFLHERILLPNGMFIDYTGLRVTEDDQLVYGVNGVAKNIWGGTTLENICQALARIVVTDQAVEIDKHVIPVVAWTHDENLAIGPEDRADENQEAMFQIMKTSPAWAPDLPLDAEGGYDRSYSK